MTSDAEERRLLELARGEWSPRAGDSQRVLAALKARFPSSDGPSERAAADSHGAATHEGETLRARPGGALNEASQLMRLAPWATRAGVALVIAGSSGALGYWLGYRAASRAELTSALARQASTPTRKAAAVSSVSSPVVRVPTVAPLAAPVAEEAVAARPPLPREQAPTGGGSGRPSAEGSLEEEVRMLRRVERALREQNPRLALALLSKLDASVPRGQLQEERVAAEIAAKCALGHGSPANLLKDFTARYARSAYLARVGQACAPEGEAAPRGE